MMKILGCAIAIAMAVAGCTADRGQGGAAPAPIPSAQATPTTSAAALVLQAIGDRRAVLLGEMHGTRETPALAGQLVSHYAAAHRPVLLGLEIDHDEQAAVDRYLASKGDARARLGLLAGEQWLAPFDGRDSQAMFALIEHVRRLRTIGADVGIVYFDDASSDMTRRNRRMAETLRAAAIARPEAMLVVLTGNVHAMTRPPPGDLYLDGRRIQPPVTMGRDLADLQPVSIDVSAASGDYWACLHAGTCERQALRPHAPQAQARMEKAHPAESAWDFSLVLPRFHASTPAAQAERPQAHGDTARGH